MRKTWAIVVEISVGARCPEILEWIGPKLDAANFRFVQEIAHLEVEQVTDENLGKSLAYVHRAVNSIFLPALRQILNRPELTEAEAKALASVELIEVENIPRRRFSHWQEQPNPAWPCPICGLPMILRDGYDAAFYGCQDFPRCKGKRARSA